MKNVQYIINTSQEKNNYFADRKRKWTVKWTNYGKESKGGHIDRCVKGGNAEDIFEQFETMISELQTEYEVWLVHSGLSYKKLKEN